MSTARGKSSKDKGDEPTEFEGIFSQLTTHGNSNGDNNDMGGPSFFQIIHNYLVEHKEITIPQRFVMGYGDDLSARAVLKVPSGEEWFVDIERDSTSDDGGVYFKKGLTKLFESYSITTGHFLVFKYEGSSHFSLRICQVSGDEINYSSYSSSEDDSYVEASEDDNYSSNEDDYYVEPSEDDNYSSSEDDFHVEASEDDNDDSEDESDDDECEEIRVDFMKKKKRSFSLGLLRTQERATEVERSFESSKNYPFFAIGLQQSYVAHKYLPIPSNFEGREELRKLKNLRLDVLNGGSWNVSINLPGPSQGPRMGAGVAKFLKDNNLKEGDVCLFEIVAEKNSCSYEHARVHIVRS